MKIARLIPLAMAAASLGGCGASLPSVTTGSLFGGNKQAAGAPIIQNDPVSRALDVAGTSARAIKCGYNFDPVKLRTQFLAAETAANPGASNLPQIYDTAFNGVSTAIAEKTEEYCTPDKTARIKTALNRHLAGDYTPGPPEPKQDDGGLFGSWGSGGSDKTNDTDGVNSKGVFE